MDEELGEEHELMAGLLSKTTRFRLLVSGEIGVKEIDRLIRKLEFDKELLLEEEEEEVAEEDEEEDDEEEPG